MRPHHVNTVTLMLTFTSG